MVPTLQLSVPCTFKYTFRFSIDLQALAWIVVRCTKYREAEINDKHSAGMARPGSLLHRDMPSTLQT